MYNTIMKNLPKDQKEFKEICECGKTHILYTDDDENIFCIWIDIYIKCECGNFVKIQVPTLV